MTYFHLALEHIIDGFNRQNRSSPPWECTPSSTFVNCSKSTPRLHLEGNVPVLPQRPAPLLQTPSVDVLASQAKAAQRSLRERGRGEEGLGWAAERRPATVGERLHEAHRERRDPGEKGSARAGVPREPGPCAWALSARPRRLRRPSQVAPRFSPPSEGRWYIPGDSESLKRARGGRT